MSAPPRCGHCNSSLPAAQPETFACIAATSTRWSTRFSSPDVLRPTEATFCLLDQRTFECRWDTVRKLAAYRATDYKIELFYFLANGWLERAFAALEDYDKWQAWWGRSDWQSVATMTRRQRAEELCIASARSAREMRLLPRRLASLACR